MCLKESNEKIRLTIATERRQQSHIHFERNFKKTKKTTRERFDLPELYCVYCWYCGWKL